MQTGATQILTAALADLDPVVAYGVWRLRQDVFVVEQECAYHDLDGRDLEPGTRQVVLLASGGGSPAPDGAASGSPDGAGAARSAGDLSAAPRVLGTARVLDDGDVWRVGRVALARSARGRGLSDVVMRAALAHVEASGDDRDVVLDAQSPLVGWYGTHGFAPDGPEFLEDGIPHTPMRRRR